MALLRAATFGVSSELQEARILNRIVRWSSEGWEYEADQRHVEIACKMMGVGDKDKPLKAPGDEECSKILEDDLEDVEESSRKSNNLTKI